MAWSAHSTYVVVAGQRALIVVRLHSHLATRVQPATRQGRACLAAVAGGLGLLRGRPTGHPGDHRASHPCRTGRGCRLRAGLPARLRHHQASAEPAPAGRCRWPSTSATSSYSPLWAPATASGVTLPLLPVPDGRLPSRRWRLGWRLPWWPGHGDGGQRPDAGASREALVDNPLPLGGVAGRLAGVPALELRRWPRSSGRRATAAHTAAPGPPSPSHPPALLASIRKSPCNDGSEPHAREASTRTPKEPAPPTGPGWQRPEDKRRPHRLRPLTRWPAGAAHQPDARACPGRRLAA
jgi:hypothetical protein